jgi:hypothetical protein
MGDLNALAGVCPSPPALARFPPFDYPSNSIPSCYWVAIPIFSEIPAYLLVVHFFDSGASYSLLLCRTGNYSQSDQILHSSSILIVVLSSSVGGRLIPSVRLGVILMGFGGYDYACSSIACLMASFTVFSPPSSS